MRLCSCSRSARLNTFTSALVLALLTLPSTASADWFSFPTTPSEPGELSPADRVIVTLVGAGAAVPMVYAGVGAVVGATGITAKGNVGLAVTGGGLGLLTALYLPYLDEPGGKAFAYTFLGGMFWGVAGVGAGGLISENHRAPWLGGSMGYGAFALYRGVLSLTGHNDVRSAAAAQILLGIIGAGGCFADMNAAERTELYLAIGCSTVSLAATLHGIVRVGKPDRPRPPTQPETTDEVEQVVAYPVPWLSKDAAGVAVAGVF